VLGMTNQSVAHCLRVALSAPLRPFTVAVLTSGSRFWMLELVFAALGATMVGMVLI